MVIKTRCRRCLFFLILAITCLPLVAFPLISHYYHEIYRVPSVQDGVLDLQGYDFNRGREIPLDGQWEFYWQKWIVTDGLEQAEPDFMATVPLTWDRYELDGRILPVSGFASYRLRLKNCPVNMELMSYVPNLDAAYRVFLNGKVIASNGLLEREPDDRNGSLGVVRERFNLRCEPDSELVIEISSSSLGGLYMTPVLSENARDYLSSRLSYVVTSAYVGILLVTIGCFAYILYLQDSHFHSAALLVVDILVSLRILVKDEFFGIFKTFVPLFRFYWVNALLQSTTLFLPVIFLYCARDLLGIAVKTRTLRFIIIFEAAVSLPLFYCILKGKLMLQYLLCLVCFLPFIAVIRSLYKSLDEKQPYTMVTFTGMMLTISSMVVASMYMSGALRMNVSMYPPTCFILGVLLQDYIYIRRNNDLRRQAQEAVDLRLRLQESETKLMLSQIKPHFLYNALIAIQVLCTREPESAEQAIVQFSRYLRANMESINSRDPIPFSHELEHIRNYVAIEKLRFKERLDMRYEIGTDDFLVPPLTIQPLVENAIKHGACKRVAGGTVWLRTREEADCWCVEVADNGPGFDVSILEGESAQSYGLRNISFRLKQLIYAEIDLHSTPDEGTEIRIRIPKGEDMDEGNHSG